LINAPASTLWGLLTDLDEQSRWISLLVGINGKMALGEQVSFAAPEAPRQTFSSRVVAYDEAESMVW
jgi:hypothetical protein